MAFQFVLILYWIALATWFGGVLFILVAAPIVFRTVRENDPLLPTVLSVNMEGQHGTLLAGTIMGNLLAALTRIELICAVGLLVTLVAQWFMIRPSGGAALLSAIVRSALYVAVVVFVLYDWRVVWPRVWKYRQEFLDNADEPEKANPAKDQFDRYQRESVNLLMIRLALLLAIVLFSGSLSQPATSTTFTFSSRT